MLTDVHIQNFRCFEDLTVSLKPLTVLIGPNDTGKSAFLDSLTSLGQKQGKHFEQSDVRTSRDGRAPAMLVEAICAGRQHPLKVEASVGPEGHPDIRAGNNLTSMELQRFQLPVNGVATTCRGFDDDTRSQFPLGSDGANTAAVLDKVFRDDLDKRIAIRRTLRDLVPGCNDILMRTPTTETRRVHLLVDGGVEIEAGRTSAGVRLLMFFLALVHHPFPPKIVLIEEPETGIHPKRLADVMRLLRGMTTGEFGGSKVQVILTTHSPYLLDCVDMSTDQVLVFQRCDDGSRTATPADQDHLKEFFDGFMLGEVWFNADEAGLIGAR